MVNDDYGYHELLHTAHIMLCSWDEHVCAHGVMNEEPDLSKAAEHISTLMMQFYQKVTIAREARFGGGDSC